MTKIRVSAMLLALALFSWSGRARAGYTHYWKWLGVPNAAALEVSLVEMDKLATAKRAILSDRGGHTDEFAHFNGTCPWGEEAGESPCIVFNGIGPDQHERFGFPLAPFTNDPAFSFVKTAYKPYDVVAVACLIVARDHFAPEVLEISSDGTWADDFTAGAQLYEKVLGRRAHDPLSPRVERASASVETPPPVTRATARYRWLLFGAIAIAFVVVLVVYRE